MILFQQAHSFMAFQGSGLSSGVPLILKKQGRTGDNG